MKLFYDNHDFIILIVIDFVPTGINKNPLFYNFKIEIREVVSEVYRDR